MKKVSINENPKETDTIVFELDASDVSGCYLANPYRVDSVVIYYVERDFSSTNSIQYNSVVYDETKLQLSIAAEKNACENPTQDNIDTAKKLRDESNSNSVTNSLFYNKVKPVKVIGQSDFPAWLSTDLDNAQIDNVEEDADGNTIYGAFTYEWDTTGMREGDYFICWTWTPLVAGDSLTKHQKFYLNGNTVVTCSIPTHYTQPDKYNILLERYLPEMFKSKLSDDDRSPDILDKFNKSVASGFTVVENLANQLVDLLDANSTHEQFLYLLANLFGLTLKTNDPTLWRRQIKNAIPLFKKKGTKKGLEEALAQASIKMSKLTRLWQIVSKYTFIETFKFDGSISTWELSKVALSLDLDNFSLSMKPKGESTYIDLSSDYIEIITEDGVSTAYWVGNTLSIEPIDLIEGDIVKILYKYKEVPSDLEQSLENYVRQLPLADTRNENDQTYPLKNWNVKIIEEDDPVFSVIINEKHPFTNEIVFGKIRTEFPYSENTYNKDEYNGSLRNSKLPCDIDKDFVDQCSYCLSSKFNINLEIENLSNERITEAQEIIKEFTPFHAIIQTMNFLGTVNEYLEPQLEEIDFLVNIQGEETVIANDAQIWFNRSMTKGLTTNKVVRTDLADSEEVVSTTSGLAYNNSINLFCGDVNFENIGMKKDGTAVLEILSPSVNTGSYTLSNAKNNIVEITGAIEPIDTAAFSFRVSNIITNGTLCNIYQDNVFVFGDTNEDFSLYDLKSVWDVENNGASNYWTVLIPYYSGTPFVVFNILPDGTLILENNGALPLVNTTSITYELKNEVGTTVFSSGSGTIKVRNRGKVQVLDSGLTDVRNFIRGNCYLESSIQYKIYGFVAGEVDQFYIYDYNSGDAAGVNLKINQRLVDNKVGYLSFSGLKLLVVGDFETSLGIQNGHRNLVSDDNRVENDGFKENFLVSVNGENYLIEDIDGDSPGGFTTFTLDGNNTYWGSFTEGGTTVSFTISKYTKKPILIQRPLVSESPHYFRTYDRAGREIISYTILNEDEVFALGMDVPEDGMNDFVYQNEGISYQIEWLDEEEQ